MTNPEKEKLLHAEGKLLEAEALMKLAMRLSYKSYQQRQRAISGAYFSIRSALGTVQEMLPPRKGRDFSIPKNG